MGNLLYFFGFRFASLLTKKGGRTLILALDFQIVAIHCEDFIKIRFSPDKGSVVDPKLFA
jgi:hypothetical protein